MAGEIADSSGRRIGVMSFDAREGAARRDVYGKLGGQRRYVQWRKDAVKGKVGEWRDLPRGFGESFFLALHHNEQGFHVVGPDGRSRVWSAEEVGRELRARKKELSGFKQITLLSCTAGAESPTPDRAQADAQIVADVSGWTVNAPVGEVNFSQPEGEAPRVNLKYDADGNATAWRTFHPQGSSGTGDGSGGLRNAAGRTAPDTTTQFPLHGWNSPTNQAEELNPLHLLVDGQEVTSLGSLSDAPAQGVLPWREWRALDPDTRDTSKVLIDTGVLSQRELHELVDQLAGLDGARWAREVGDFASRLDRVARAAGGGDGSQVRWSGEEVQARFQELKASLGGLEGLWSGVEFDEAVARERAGEVRRSADAVAQALNGFMVDAARFGGQYYLRNSYVPTVAAARNLADAVQRAAAAGNARELVRDGLRPVAPRTLGAFAELVRAYRGRKAYASLPEGEQWGHVVPDLAKMSRADRAEFVRELSRGNVAALRSDVADLLGDRQWRDLYERLRNLPLRLKHATPAFHAIANSGVLVSLSALERQGDTFLASGWSEDDTALLGNGDFAFFRVESGDAPMQTRYGPTTLVFGIEELERLGGWVSLHDQGDPLGRASMRELRMPDRDLSLRSSRVLDGIDFQGERIQWVNTYPDAPAGRRRVLVSFEEEVFHGADVREGIALSVLREVARIGGDFPRHAFGLDEEGLGKLVSRLYRPEAKFASGLPIDLGLTKQPTGWPRPIVVHNPDGDGRYLPDGTIDPLAMAVSTATRKADELALGLEPLWTGFQMEAAELHALSREDNTYVYVLQYKAERFRTRLEEILDDYRSADRKVFDRLVVFRSDAEGGRREVAERLLKERADKRAQVTARAKEMLEGVERVIADRSGFGSGERLSPFDAVYDDPAWNWQSLLYEGVVGRALAASPAVIEGARRAVSALHALLASHYGAEAASRVFLDAEPRNAAEVAQAFDQLLDESGEATLADLMDAFRRAAYANTEEQPNTLADLWESKPELRPAGLAARPPADLPYSADQRQSLTLRGFPLSAGPAAREQWLLAAYHQVSGASILGPFARAVMSHSLETGTASMVEVLQAMQAVYSTNKRAEILSGDALGMYQWADETVAAGLPEFVPEWLREALTLPHLGFYRLMSQAVSREAWSVGPDDLQQVFASPDIQWPGALTSQARSVGIAVERWKADHGQQGSVHLQPAHIAALQLYAMTEQPEDAFKKFTSRFNVATRKLLATWLDVWKDLAAARVKARARGSYSGDAELLPRLLVQSPQFRKTAEELDQVVTQNTADWPGHLLRAITRRLDQIAETTLRFLPVHAYMVKEALTALPPVGKEVFLPTWMEGTVDDILWPGREIHFEVVQRATTDLEKALQPLLKLNIDRPQFRAVFRVLASTGRDVAPFSDRPDTKLVLFPPGMKFTVVDKRFVQGPAGPACLVIASEATRLPSPTPRPPTDAATQDTPDQTPLAEAQFPKEGWNSTPGQSDVMDDELTSSDPVMPTLYLYSHQGVIQEYSSADGMPVEAMDWREWRNLTVELQSKTPFRVDGEAYSQLDLAAVVDHFARTGADWAERVARFASEVDHAARAAGDWTGRRIQWTGDEVRERGAGRDGVPGGRSGQSRAAAASAGRSFSGVFASAGDRMPSMGGRAGSRWQAPEVVAREITDSSGRRIGVMSFDAKEGAARKDVYGKLGGQRRYVQWRKDAVKGKVGEWRDLPRGFGESFFLALHHNEQGFHVVGPDGRSRVWSAEEVGRELRARKKELSGFKQITLLSCTAGAESTTTDRTQADAQIVADVSGWTVNAPVGEVAFTEWGQDARVNLKYDADGNATAWRTFHPQGSSGTGDGSGGLRNAAGRTAPDTTTKYPPNGWNSPTNQAEELNPLHLLVDGQEVTSLGSLSDARAQGVLPWREWRALDPFTRRRTKVLIDTGILSQRELHALVDRLAGLDESRWAREVGDFASRLDRVARAAGGGDGSQVRWSGEEVQARFQELKASLEVLERLLSGGDFDEAVARERAGEVRRSADAVAQALNGFMVDAARFGGQYHLRDSFVPTVAAARNLADAVQRAAAAGNARELVRDGLRPVAPRTLEVLAELVRAYRGRKAYASLPDGVLWHLVVPDLEKMTRADRAKFVRELSRGNVTALRSDVGVLLGDKQWQDLYERLRNLPLRLKHATPAFHAIANSGVLVSLSALERRGEAFLASGWSEADAQLLGNGDFAFFRVESGDAPMQTRYGPTTLVFGIEELERLGGWVSLHDQGDPLGRASMRELRMPGRERPLRSSRVLDGIDFHGQRIQWVNTYPDAPAGRRRVLVSFEEEVFHGADVREGIALSVLREVARIGGDFPQHAFRLDEEGLGKLVTRLYRPEAKFASGLPIDLGLTKQPTGWPRPIVVHNPDGDGRYLPDGTIDPLAMAATKATPKADQLALESENYWAEFQTEAAELHASSRANKDDVLREKAKKFRTFLEEILDDYRSADRKVFDRLVVFRSDAAGGRRELAERLLKERADKQAQVTARTKEMLEEFQRIIADPSGFGSGERLSPFDAAYDDPAWNWQSLLYEGVVGRALAASPAVIEEARGAVSALHVLLASHYGAEAASRVFLDAERRNAAEVAQAFDHLLGESGEAALADLMDAFRRAAYANTEERPNTLADLWESKPELRPAGLAARPPADLPYSADERRSLTLRGFPLSSGPADSEKWLLAAYDQSSVTGNPNLFHLAVTGHSLETGTASLIEVLQAIQAVHPTNKRAEILSGDALGMYQKFEGVVDAELPEFVPEWLREALTLPHLGFYRLMSQAVRREAWSVGPDDLQQVFASPEIQWPGALTSQARSMGIAVERWKADHGQQGSVHLQPAHIAALQLYAMTELPEDAFKKFTSRFNVATRKLLATWLDVWKNLAAARVKARTLGPYSGDAKLLPRLLVQSPQFRKTAEELDQVVTRNTADWPGHRIRAVTRSLDQIAETTLRFLPVHAYTVKEALAALPGIGKDIFLPRWMERTVDESTLWPGSDVSFDAVHKATTDPGEALELLPKPHINGPKHLTVLRVRNSTGRDVTPFSDRPDTKLVLFPPGTKFTVVEMRVVEGPAGSAYLDVTVDEATALPSPTPRPPTDAATQDTPDQTPLAEAQFPKEGWNSTPGQSDVMDDELTSSDPVMPTLYLYSHQGVIQEYSSADGMPVEAMDWREWRNLTVELQSKTPFRVDGEAYSQLDLAAVVDHFARTGADWAERVARFASEVDHAARAAGDWTGGRIQWTGDEVRERSAGRDGVPGGRSGQFRAAAASAGRSFSGVFASAGDRMPSMGGRAGSRWQAPEVVAGEITDSSGRRIGVMSFDAREGAARKDVYGKLGGQRSYVQWRKDAVKGKVGEWRDLPRGFGESFFLALHHNEQGFHVVGPDGRSRVWSAEEVGRELRARKKELSGFKQITLLSCTAGAESTTPDRTQADAQIVADVSGWTVNAPVGEVAFTEWGQDARVNLKYDADGNATAWRTFHPQGSSGTGDGSGGLRNAVGGTAPDTAMQFPSNGWNSPTNQGEELNPPYFVFDGEEVTSLGSLSDARARGVLPWREWRALDPDTRDTTKVLIDTGILSQRELHELVDRFAGLDGSRWARRVRDFASRLDRAARAAGGGDGSQVLWTGEEVQARFQELKASLDGLEQLLSGGDFYNALTEIDRFRNRWNRLLHRKVGDSGAAVRRVLEHAGEVRRFADVVAQALNGFMVDAARFGGQYHLRDSFVPTVAAARNLADAVQRAVAAGNARELVRDGLRPVAPSTLGALAELVRAYRGRKAYASVPEGKQWGSVVLDLEKMSRADRAEFVRELSRGNVAALRSDVADLLGDKQWQDLYERLRNLPLRLKHATPAFHAIANSGVLVSLSALERQGDAFLASGWSKTDAEPFGNGDFAFFRVESGDAPMQTRYGPTTLVFGIEELERLGGWVSLHDQGDPLGRASMRELRMPGRERPLRSARVLDGIDFHGERIQWVNTYPDGLAGRRRVLVSFEEEVFHGADVREGIALSVLREVARIGGDFPRHAFRLDEEGLGKLVSRLYRPEAKFASGLPIDLGLTQQPTGWPRPIVVHNPDGDGRYLPDGTIDPLAKAASKDAKKADELAVILEFLETRFEMEVAEIQASSMADKDDVMRESAKAFRHILVTNLPLYESAEKEVFDRLVVFLSDAEGSRRELAERLLKERADKQAQVTARTKEMLEEAKWIIADPSGFGSGERLSPFDAVYDDPAWTWQSLLYEGMVGRALAASPAVIEGARRAVSELYALLAGHYGAEAASRVFLDAEPRNAAEAVQAFDHLLGESGEAALADLMDAFRRAAYANTEEQPNTFADLWESEPELRPASLTARPPADLPYPADQRQSLTLRGFMLSAGPADSEKWLLAAYDQVSGADNPGPFHLAVMSHSLETGTASMIEVLQAIQAVHPTKKRAEILSGDALGMYQWADETVAAVLPEPAPEELRAGLTLPHLGFYRLMSQATRREAQAPAPDDLQQVFASPGNQWRGAVTSQTLSVAAAVERWKADHRQQGSVHLQQAHIAALQLHATTEQPEDAFKKFTSRFDDATGQLLTNWLNRWKNIAAARVEARALGPYSGAAEMLPRLLVQSPQFTKTVEELDQVVTRNTADWPGHSVRAVTRRLDQIAETTLSFLPVHAYMVKEALTALPPVGKEVFLPVWMPGTAVESPAQLGGEVRLALVQRATTDLEKALQLLPKPNSDGPQHLVVFRVRNSTGRDVRPFSDRPDTNLVLFPPDMKFTVVDKRAVRGRAGSAYVEVTVSEATPLPSPTPRPPTEAGTQDTPDQTPLTEAQFPKEGWNSIPGQSDVMDYGLAVSTPALPTPDASSTRSSTLADPGQSGAGRDHAPQSAASSSEQPSTPSSDERERWAAVNAQVQAIADSKGKRIGLMSFDAKDLEKRKDVYRKLAEQKTYLQWRVDGRKRVGEEWDLPEGFGKSFFLALHHDDKGFEVVGPDGSTRVWSAEELGQVLHTAKNDWSEFNEITLLSCTAGAQSATASHAQPDAQIIADITGLTVNAPVGQVTFSQSEGEAPRVHLNYDADGKATAWRTFHPWGKSATASGAAGLGKTARGTAPATTTPFPLGWNNTSMSAADDFLRRVEEVLDVAGVGARKRSADPKGGGQSVAWGDKRSSLWWRKHRSDRAFAGRVTVYPGTEDEGGHPRAELVFSSLDSVRHQALADSPWPYRVENDSVVYGRLAADQVGQILQAAATGKAGRPWQRYGLGGAEPRTKLEADRANRLVPESQKWATSLSAAERKYVRGYTDYAFKPINMHLKKEDFLDIPGSKLGAPMETVLGHLDLAIAKAATPNTPHITYHGHNIPPEVLKAENVEDWVRKAFPVGSTYRHAPYMSSSHCPQTASGFAKDYVQHDGERHFVSRSVVFEVVSSRGAAVAEIAKYGNVERERLLPRGSTFRVVGRHENVSVGDTVTTVYGKNIQVHGKKVILVQLVDVKDIPRDWNGNTPLGARGTSPGTTAVFPSDGWNSGSSAAIASSPGSGSSGQERFEGVSDMSDAVEQVLTAGVDPRMHYPGKIDGEVPRLVAKAEGGIDRYLAEYDTWQANHKSPKWGILNSEPNNSIEYLKRLVGPPQGRGRGELVAALETSIRADLTATASKTMANFRAAALGAKRKLVLGRKGDISQWAAYQQGKRQVGDRLSEDARIGRRLNISNWSVAANYAFVDGGIAERAVFKIVTSLGPRIEGMLIGGQLNAGNFWQEIENLGNGALWDSNRSPDEGGPSAVLGHEILQLIESGYQFFGRESTFAQGNARLVAIHPDRPAPAPGDKTQPLTLP
ncbi:hypothetical protein OHB49_43640 (plasmid) [Streptomyces sp. NBC_01717]|uniref:ADP-ribosyltransferase n=1 Tax=Streptomyces sp. NBC_01717 TaxID=2975918 RepID=UPI002E316EB5|nr:ADP-ribosyltransferase [Streptomyces sp. NBC_01717]